MGEAILENRSIGYRRLMTGSGWITVTATVSANSNVSGNPAYVSRTINLPTALTRGKWYDFHIFLDGYDPLYYGGESQVLISYTSSGTSSLYGTIADIKNHAPKVQDTRLQIVGVSSISSYNQISIQSQSATNYTVMIQYKQRD